jgi:hypothetical protein
VARATAPVGAGRHADQVGEATAEGAQRRAADREPDLSLNPPKRTCEMVYPLTFSPIGYGPAMTPDYRPSLIRSFGRHLRAENRSEHTIASYLESLRQAEAFLTRRGRETPNP